MRGNPPARRGKRAEAPDAPTSGAGSEERAGDRALVAHRGRDDGETETFVTEHRPEPIAFHMTQDPIAGPVRPALSRNADFGICFDEAQITSRDNRSRPEPGDPCPSLSATGRPTVALPWAVRRLTPRERERLQGFPDDWTAIPGAKDGPRNAALGNSMAVPVMRWIGRRIALADRVVRALDAKGLR